LDSFAYPDVTSFVAGVWSADRGARRDAIVDPATSRTLGEFAHATVEDLDRAVQAAGQAFPAWRRTAPLARSQLIRRAAQLIRDRRETIAKVLTLEEGKTLAESLREVSLAADLIDWCAEQGRRSYGRIIPSDPETRLMVVQEPVGPCAAFTPWNFPAIAPARKIGSALAAGCTLIIKPSEETPGTCLEIVRAFHDAGLPPGVLNMVVGDPQQISAFLIERPVIRKISFTGSVPVGKTLTAMAAGTLKRVTMELGGHAPVVIFEDADLERAADLLLRGKFMNAGQVCIAPTRFFVHESVAEDFSRRFAQRVRGLLVGNGLDPEVKMGPLANERRRQAMDGFIADARQRGGRILAGGERLSGPGFFYAPTVVSGIADDSRLMTEEPFGPVAIIAPFQDFDEAIARANALPFGLAAYAFTESAKCAHRVADALEAGMVAINSTTISTPESPFGGVKESGLGHEGGIEGLEGYMNKKFVLQS
jgi:succinate-semialdehyde dehydrogenase/glutarate-semialdehyde dehydrogenase